MDSDGRGVVLKIDLSSVDNYEKEILKFRNAIDGDAQCSSKAQT